MLVGGSAAHSTLNFCACPVLWGGVILVQSVNCFMYSTGMYHELISRNLTQS